MKGMRVKQNLLKTTVGVALVAMAIFAVRYKPASAQTSTRPQFLVTWSASNSYVPTGYAGQILPNQSSKITAALELISNGQTLNLSNQIIYWYLDDTLLGGGLGVQSFTFRPYGEAPTTATLKIELPDYPGGELIHDVAIPVVSPVAIAEAPYPNETFSESPIILTAVPYFFNASSVAPLSFAWTVNDQAVTSAENPQSLKVSLPQSTAAGFAVNITLAIKNSLDGMNGNDSINLTYQPQP
jgi:hypothetical protein